MISAQTLQTLEMLRKAPRKQQAPVPTKWPRGGRPNPCATHREAPHPLAMARREGTTAPVQPRRTKTLAAVDRMVAAVKNGELPIGQMLTPGQLTRVIGKKAWSGGWENLSVSLAAAGHPYRLRAIGSGRKTRHLIEEA
jgi:hypothetical protein